MLAQLKCKLSLHHWKPYGIQTWIDLRKKVAAYRGAQCSRCFLQADEETVFKFSEIPIDQILGAFSPYQTLIRDGLWLTAGCNLPKDITYGHDYLRTLRQDD